MKKKPIKKEIRSQIEREWETKSCFVQDNPCCVYMLWTKFRGKEYEAVGVARCLPRDTWDGNLGFSIARTRAYRRAHRKIYTDYFLGAE